jgi:hypothetical protein
VAGGEGMIRTHLDERATGIKPVPSFTNVRLGPTGCSSRMWQGDKSVEAASLDVITDRGHFNSGEILACDELRVAEVNSSGR